MHARPKAVIFARVSSKAQEDEGYSLDSQLKLLRNYCKKKRFTIDKEFKVAETASNTQRRTVFHELLRYIAKNKVHHFVVEKTDRAVRNMKDAAYIYDWIEGDERRVLHSVKEGLELHKWSKSQVKLMWDIFVAFAKQYTDGLREEAMKGWDEKLAQGWLPAPPPPGYMTVTEQSKRIHIPNPAIHMSIEPLFRFALLPDSTITTSTQESANLGITTRKGKPLSKNSVYKLLTNPFYIGINRFNGKKYPGAQEPLISKELFYAVQDKLHNRRRIKNHSHNPVFKGMIRCKHCQAMVTWQKQKGRYYGVCQRKTDACKGKRMLREDRLEVQLTSLLEELKDPGGKVLIKLEAALRVGQPGAIVGEHREAIIKSLNKQLKRLQDMSDALYDDKLANYISTEKFEHKQQELTAQMLEAQSRLTRLYEMQGKQKEKLKRQSESPIVNLYLQSLPGQKRTIIAQLYGDILADGDCVKFAVLR
ncbi:MAG TPA: recombinase family protein [Candidatus Saccharimonadales bacterium]|nr:recombinase family protein [Candidatus Saccharimonadales bacterium]